VGREFKGNYGDSNLDSSPWKGEAGREFMENSGVPNFLLDKDIWRGQTESV
jgi:hypothetical protein